MGILILCVAEAAQLQQPGAEQPPQPRGADGGAVEPRHGRQGGGGLGPHRAGGQPHPRPRTRPAGARPPRGVGGRPHGALQEHLRHHGAGQGKPFKGCPSKIS